VNYDFALGIAALVVACVMIKKVINIGNNIIKQKRCKMIIDAKQARLDKILAEQSMKKPIDELTKL